MKRIYTDLLMTLHQEDFIIGRFYNSHTPQYRVNVVDDDNESMNIDKEDTNFTAEFSNNKGFSNAYTAFDTPFVPNFTENFKDNDVDMNVNDRTFNNFERGPKKKAKNKKRKKNDVKEKPRKKMKETVNKKRKRNDDDQEKPKKMMKARKPRLEPTEIPIDENDVFEGF